MLCALSRPLWQPVRVPWIRPDYPEADPDQFVLPARNGHGRRDSQTMLRGGFLAQSGRIALHNGKGNMVAKFRNATAETGMSNFERTFRREQ